MAETKPRPGPVLSLDTLVERRTIRIRSKKNEPNGGTLYELLNAGELSILDYHRIARQGARVQEMMEQSADLTDDQVEELRTLLDGMCKVVLRAPLEVHGRLTDQQKLQVITVFTQLQRGETAPAAGGAEAAPKTSSIGESRSPA
jgi:hypothetical protein